MEAKPGERLEYARREQLLSPTARRLMYIGNLLSTGGLSRLDSVEPEEVERIEKTGFDPKTLQSYLNNLVVEGEFEDAAMLRGAFNDLLEQLDRKQALIYDQTLGKPKNLNQINFLV